MPCPLLWRSIAKTRFIGQYPQYKSSKKAGIGSKRETAMHRFGKFSIWTAAGLVCVSGLLLLPTPSSAQYINIEGMIRGALRGGGIAPYNGGGGGGGGGGYVRHRASSGYTSRHVRAQPKEQDPAPVDRNKERDATQVESASSAPSTRTMSAPPPPPPPDTSARQTSAAPRGNDEPSFSPSR
jgi:hypothetical protein